MKYLSLFIVTILITACNTEPQHDERSVFAGTWVSPKLLKERKNFCSLLQRLEKARQFERLEYLGYTVNYGGEVFSNNFFAEFGHDPQRVWKVNPSGKVAGSRLNKDSKSCKECGDINDQTMTLLDHNSLLVTWDMDDGSGGKELVPFQYIYLEGRTYARLLQAAKYCRPRG